MLAVPLLLGIAATAASAWHLPLAIAAVAGYLAAATAQAWLRARRRPDFVPSLALYVAVFAIAGLVLAVAFPALLLAAVVVVPAGALVVGGARPGTPRDLVNSLAQTAIALVLVPAAGHVSGAWDAIAIAIATAVAAGYLVGTVFVVRSVIRERGNRGFAALSVGFHVACTIVAAAMLAWPYAVYFVGLTGRAIALPAVERRAARRAAPAAADPRRHRRDRRLDGPRGPGVRRPAPAGVVGGKTPRHATAPGASGRHPKRAAWPLLAVVPSGSARHRPAPIVAAECYDPPNPSRHLVRGPSAPPRRPRCRDPR